MSNLLDKASIILTPTAYNNGKALCVKPSDGSGDFDFSRNSAATRVNAQGLVENVQILSSNLVQNGDFSEEGVQEVSNGSFTNGSTDWALGTGWSIGEDKAVANTIGDFVNLYQNSVFVVGKTYKTTFTIVDYTQGSVRLTQGGIDVSGFQNAVGTYTAYFTATQTSLYMQGYQSFIGSITNISVKEVGQNWILDANWSIAENKAVSDGTNGFMRTFTNVFESGKTYKVGITVSNITTGQVSYPYDGAATSYISANGIYETIYTPNTTNVCYVYGRNGFDGSITNISVIEITDDTNLPRINYEGFSFDGSGNIIPNSGCGSWLFEPQSTNLITQSELFSDSSWTKSGSLLVSPNSVISPDGTLNGSTITGLTGSGGNDLYVTTSINPANTTYTYSIYLKGSGTIRMQMSNNVDNAGSRILTLSSSWVRYDLTQTFNATAGSLVGNLDDSGGTATTYDVWGAQIEQQSYATSYIPTSGSTVTRNQDVCTNGGSLASINSTSGTLYFEGAALVVENSQKWIALSDGTHNNTIKIGILNSATNYKIAADVRVGGVNQAFLAYDFGAVAPTFKKCAIKYKQNDFALWIDGVEVATDTSGNTPIGLNELTFTRGDTLNPFFGKTKCLAVFPYLTDSELTELTTI